MTQIEQIINEIERLKAEQSSYEAMPKYVKLHIIALFERIELFIKCLPQFEIVNSTAINLEAELQRLSELEHEHACQSLSWKHLCNVATDEGVCTHKEIFKFSKNRQQLLWVKKDECQLYYIDVCELKELPKKEGYGM